MPAGISPGVRQNNDFWFWLLALIMGTVSGYAHVIVPDPTIVALLALACAMVLGFLRSQRPWRWALILSAAIPAADLVMYLRGMTFYRGRMEGAFVAGLASGIVGTYAGALGRRTLSALTEKTDLPSR